MIQNNHMHWISKWMVKSQTQVLDKFASIPTAFSDGKGQKRFVFIPGTRKDKVLLVAHADHVWASMEENTYSPIRVAQKDDIIFSLKRDVQITWTYPDNTTRKTVGIGIAADDRAGCGIVWKLRDLGHSILITSGEEIGCITTKKLMKHDYWRKVLNDHSFAVQFDRRGKNDIVFYDVGTNKFVEYVKENTNYIPQQGTTTDIRHICTDICGVNMSVGYYHEHTGDEILLLDQFENTLRTAREWLSKANIPRFELIKSDEFDISSLKKKDKKKKIYITENNFANNVFNIDVSRFKKNIPENVVSCDCGKKMTQESWLKSNFICNHCKQIV